MATPLEIIYGRYLKDSCLSLCYSILFSLCDLSPHPIPPFPSHQHPNNCMCVKCSFLSGLLCTSGRLPKFKCQQKQAIYKPPPHVFMYVCILESRRTFVLRQGPVCLQAGLVQGAKGPCGRKVGLELQQAESLTRGAQGSGKENQSRGVQRQARGEQHKSSRDLAPKADSSSLASLACSIAPGRLNSLKPPKSQPGKAPGCLVSLQNPSGGRARSSSFHS